MTKKLGDEVQFYHSGWPLIGTVVSLTDDPGRNLIEYVVWCDKFLGARFHFNQHDQIVWIENIVSK